MNLKMNAFTITYNDQTHFSVHALFHSACQTYLHYFNCLASSDKYNTIPKKSYERAKHIKQTDNALQQGSIGLTGYQVFYGTFALAYYYYFVSKDVKCNLEKYPKDKQKCMKETRLNALAALDSICYYIHLKQAKFMAKKESHALKNSPLSEWLTNKLIGEMHGIPAF